MNKIEKIPMKICPCSSPMVSFNPDKSKLRSFTARLLGACSLLSPSLAPLSDVISLNLLASYKTNSGYHQKSLLISLNIVTRWRVEAEGNLVRVTHGAKPAQSILIIVYTFSTSQPTSTQHQQGQIL